jgi:hypothetical protein
MAYRIVNKSIFEQNARNFILNELNFNQTEIISRKYIYHSGNKTIDIVIIGKHIDSSLIENAREKLAKYSLEGATLNIRQNSIESTDNPEKLKFGIFTELYRKNDKLIQIQSEKIALLEKELLKYKFEQLPIRDITQEALSEHPNISEFSVANALLYSVKNNNYDTVFIANVSYFKKPTHNEIERLNKWLKVRVKSEKVKLILH